MQIFSWNVNGIRAVHKKGLFVPFMEKFQPDILCLQETKAFQYQHEVDLAGYHEFWNSAMRPGYSGTAIFSKEKPLSVVNGLPEKIWGKYYPAAPDKSQRHFDGPVTIPPGADLVGDGYGNPNEEGRVIAAEFKKFYVVSVYTPNSKDDLSRIPLRQKQWDPAFLAYMRQLENPSTGAQGKPIIFCGDLNVAHTEDDLAKPKQNKGKKGFTLEEREGINNAIETGFVDSFRIFTKGNGYYTWWTHFANARARNVGWRIDYIFASKVLQSKIKSAKIHADVMGSDHCPVSIEIQS